MKYGILALCLYVVLASAHGQSTPSQPPSDSVLQHYDQAIDAVAEKAMRSVVEIDVTGYGSPEHEGDDSSAPQTLQRQRSLGSGVIVDPHGYIVTNNHVVAGAVRIRVVLASAAVEMSPYHTSLARKQRS